MNAQKSLDRPAQVMTAAGGDDYLAAWPGTEERNCPADPQGHPTRRKKGRQNLGAQITTPLLLAASLAANGARIFLCARFSGVDDRAEKFERTRMSALHLRS